MKTTLNLPAGKLLWQVFLLHPLEDEMLTCKEIYVEGPCGKFKCNEYLPVVTVYRVRPSTEMHRTRAGPQPQAHRLPFLDTTTAF